MTTSGFSLNFGLPFAPKPKVDIRELSGSNFLGISKSGVDFVLYLYCDGDPTVSSIGGILSFAINDLAKNL